MVLLAAASCRRGAKTETTPSDSVERPLAAFATRRLILTPTSHVRPDSLGWVQQLGGTRAAALRLDSSLVAVLGARGLAARWILPAELTRSYERNRSYAVDPYQ